MHTRSPRVLAVFSLLVLASVPVIFVASCSKGSINGQLGSGSGYLCSAKTDASCSPPPATTLIASCVVDAQNDVIVGDSSGAKSGCTNVVMEPSTHNPSSFGSIDVQSGGTLLINGKQSGSMATSALAPNATIPAATLETPVREICVESGGTVEFGTADNPITSNDKVVLEFLGDPGDKPTGGSTCAKEGFLKGIEVLKKGTLEMYGAKGVPSRGGVSWTTLAAPAGSQVPGAKAKSLGDKTLYLTADVTKGVEGWQPGDWIVVATTNFVPFDTEFVQIASVKSGGVNKAGSTVTLVQPLKYYHFGSLPPSPATASCQDSLAATHPSAPATQPAFLCDGASQNYGVDERAEVGLISRDITLTAATATIIPPSSITNPDIAAATLNEHWGGEIKIVKDFEKVAIQGVRLSKFGKAQLGSYPIHFHKAGVLAISPSPALIDADSVDHSYNKCVTIHETSNLTVSNMVCARIVGHIFYEELGDAGKTFNADSNITFENDLGLGAMSNSFDIYGVDVQTAPAGSPIPIGPHSRDYMLEHYWWTGDYCAADKTCIGANGYDGFNIPDTDNQNQRVNGSCYTFGYLIKNAKLYKTGGPWANGGGAPCPPPKPSKPPPAGTPPNTAYTHYIEPASGFWIQNPGTNLIGDAIGGCQGVGSGFWWVTPQNSVNGVLLFYEQMGAVEDDRAHACYNGFTDDGTPGGINNVSPLYPHMLPKYKSASIISTIDGVTATRNRFRGLWLRTTWFIVKDGHFATNRDNVSLLTSGGIDGNAPGAWNLVEDSVIVGLSRNNSGRWGPCPYQQNTLEVQRTQEYLGRAYGCIDYPYTTTPHSGEIFDQGYQYPSWNSAGYYLYDGPALLHHDRFVNFNYNKGWTKSMPCNKPGQPSPGAYYRELDDADCKFIKYGELNNSFNAYGLTKPEPYAPYEGDAALGWFNSNQNSYPTGTASKQLMFVNTNLRHQVFTQYVGLGGFFNDGDKNTSILDEDGTLDGFGVQDAPNSGTYTVYPISLNNLPFNSTSNSVDECLSRGAQDQQYEGRTSALMSPASMGTLQFSSLYPYSPAIPPPNSKPVYSDQYWQDVTFIRTDAVPDGKGGTFHPTMVMKTGRNGLGSYEPKVSNGYGYYVMVSKSTATSSTNGDNAGLYKWIDITLADVVDPNLTKTHPFYIRLGIDYKSTAVGGGNTQLPPPSTSYFTVERGYKSYEGQDIYQHDPALKAFWTRLNCNNLDSQNIGPKPGQLLENLPKVDGGKGYCPGGTVSTLTWAPSIASLTDPKTGAPVINKYYYNPKTGYLWLNIVQNEANPVGPSPTGCATDLSDPACLDWDPTDPTQIPESYYACPKNGCMDYTIAVKSDSTYTYTPGPSTGRPAAASLKALQPPKSQNKLVLYNNTSTVITPVLATDATPQHVPYYTAKQAAGCKTTQPPLPQN